MKLEVELDIAQGDFRLQAAFTTEGPLTALFGRSGSGKTTLVNAIAGLIPLRHGRIVVDGQVLVDSASGINLPCHKRRTGYVFQDGRLFPHLNVRQNLLYGRWFARGDEHSPALADVVDMLGIGHLLTRRPGGLSGGEKQRVAIGRALLARPQILLMDEPLAALDEARKAELLPYIERLRDEARVPIVYVSHSLAEVARLASSVVVLEGGRIAAVGSVTEVMGRIDVPALDPDGNGGVVLDAQIIRHDADYGLTILQTPAGEIQTPRVPLPCGAKAKIFIRSRDVMLGLHAPTGLSALNILPGTIIAVEAQVRGEIPTASVLVQMDCNGARIASRITRKSLDALALQPGSPCFAIIKSVSFESRDSAISTALT